MTELAGVLALAAMGVGALHTLAPDHWVPFAALARARGWSRGRTARITAACGFGHVTVSALLGVLALYFGLEMLRLVGERMEAIAGLLLIGFGLAYGLVGLRRAVRSHAHGHDRGHVHGHGHAHHHRHVHVGGGHTHGAHDIDRLTPWTLFLLFSADPCVAVIPILFAAAPLGVWQTVFVVGAYELATIATMVVLVLPARAAAARLRAPWTVRFGDATAGAVIASVGVLVAVLGW
jgi:ABC-type nickel/cobalt efflux system permease component RcnA